MKFRHLGYFVAAAEELNFTHAADRLSLSGFRTLRMAAHHGEFAFGAPHQSMQICRLGRYACGKATGFKPPAMVEALGIGFNYKREEAFAQSGYSLLHPLPVPYIRQSSHNIHTDHGY